MDANDVAMIRRQAAARVLARKRQPTVRIQQGRTPDTDLTISEVTGSEYMEPLDVGEWIDDLISVHGHAQWRGPWTVTLMQIAGAARGGKDAAVLAAVRSARKLDLWSQWHLFVTLEQWHAAARLPAAVRLMTAVLREWEGASLTETRPDFAELPDLPRLRKPERIKYPTRFGQPAGVLPWLA
jgi:hypothetical protein